MAVQVVVVVVAEVALVVEDLLPDLEVVVRQACTSALVDSAES